MKKTDIIFLSVLGVALILCLVIIIIDRCGKDIKEFEYGTIDHSDGIITDTRTNNADNPIDYYNYLMHSNTR